MRSKETVEIPRKIYEELLETEHKYLLLKEASIKLFNILNEYNN